RLFLAATSHDVRNSLTVIAGYATALADGLPEEQSRKALARITALAQSLSTMMSDIVVHAGLGDQDKVTLRPVGIRALLTECAKDIEAQCHEKKVRLLLSLPEKQKILTDKAKLTRILQNLLGNAVRYTARGEIELRGEISPHEVRLIV